MKKVICLVMVLGMLLCFATQGWAGEGATREEVVSKCHAAAKMVQDAGIEAAKKAIGDKKGPFVWKDTYVFLMDLDAKMLAHPIKPELTQKDNLVQVKDTAGKPLFLEFVELANSKGEGWVSYMWPKPGQEKASKKISYIYRVKGTQYFVGAGIYE
jgi:signal transduction histidine kinase